MKKMQRGKEVMDKDVQRSHYQGKELRMANLKSKMDCGDAGTGLGNWKTH